ncbi:MAG TPA: M14 family zinc carboxypeptidase [Bacteroidales bacterium]|nr:M14 family zinc carboxypeptidase [Bacteroidales bacterium]
MKRLTTFTSLFILLCFFGFNLAKAQVISPYEKIKNEDAKTKEILSTLFKDFPEVTFQFTAESKEQVNTVLTKMISLDGFNSKTLQVKAVANEKEFADFLKLKIPYTIIKEQETRAITMATTVADMSSWNRYPTYSVYDQMMTNFQSKYPNLCKRYNLGNTVNGRKIIALKITNNIGSNVAKPKFLYSATMHGDETTGYIMMLRLADYLLSNYNTNSRVTNILNNIELWILPNTNPDGTYYNSSTGTSITYARRYNANGVDLNRNYPDPRTGAHPDGNSYQAETQITMGFADTLNFVMGGNFHGGASVYSYPWDTWTTSARAHADDAWYRYTAKNFADSCIYYGPLNSISNYFKDTYTSGITEGADWYVVTGGRQDFMNYQKHCREATIEISLTKKLGSELLPNYWNVLKNPMLKLLEECLYGFKGTITDACTGLPIKAKVFVNSHDKDSSWVWSGSKFGDYYRPIKAGNWSVTYSAGGYTSQTVNITTTDNALQIKNISLVPINGSSVVAGVSITANKTTICEGETITFTASPTNGGNNPTYVWKKNGVVISGAVESIYSSSSLSYGDVITCVMTSNATCVSGSPATSNAVTIQMITPSLTISANKQNICAGESVTFTANPVNCGLAPAYKWMLNGVEISGANGATYSTVSIANQDVFSCIVTSSDACSNGTQVNSNLITISVVTSVPVIANIVQMPSNVGVSDEVLVSANITDNCNLISSVNLLWCTDSISFNNTIAMSANGNVYTTTSTIPAQPGGTTVYYRIVAINNLNMTTMYLAQPYTVSNEPTYHVTNFKTGTILSNAIQLTWTDAASGVLPNGYLIKGSAVSLASITDPIDGIAETNGTLIQNIGQAVQTYTFTNLTANKTYYFKIYPYTGTAASINYKTTVTVPNVTVTTTDQTTVVAWNFPSTSKDKYADAGISGNNGTKILSENATGTPSYTSTGASTYSGSCTGWSSGSGVKYWTVSFLTTSYKNLKISSKQYSQSYAGPRDFKIQYSLNGSTYYDLTTVPQVAANWTSGVVTNYPLPAVCENQSVVYLRWIMTSNTRVGGGTVTSTGYSRIDDIIIKGDPLLPDNAGTITGPVAITTIPSSVTYSIPVIEYATNYVWTVPAGASITSGNGTNTITVNYTSSATSGNVSVYGTNANGQGGASSLAVNVSNVSILSTTPASTCGTGSVILGATASEGIINWYNVISGGISLGTGNTFNTPVISSTTTYYVDATSNGITSTPRTPVVATVLSANPQISSIVANPSIVLPTSTVVVSANVVGCNPIQSVTLNWGIDGISFNNSISMSANGSVYSTISPIPAQNENTTVYYKVNVVDNQNNSASSSIQSYFVSGEPSNHVTNFQCSNVSTNSISLTWTDASGNVLPNGYIVKCSSVSLNDITDPTDGVIVDSNDGVYNQVSYGTQNCTFSGLTSQTTYYFKIYPYTGSGSTINYKTTSAPTQSCTTTFIQPIITIGTGTAVTNINPINRYYNYSRWEAIYLKSEIGTSGNITQINFYKGAVDDGSSITAVKVYMKQTTASTLETGTWSSTGYTLVFNGTITNGTAIGWKTITLNTPFAYNNSSNLQIGIEHGSQQYTSNYAKWAYTTTTSNMSRRGAVDSGLPSSLTSTTYRPNIQIKLVASTLKTSIAENALELSFDVYPNPGSGIFTLDLDRTLSNPSFQILNNMGEVVLEKEIKNQSQMVFDLSSYANGIYFVKIVSDEIIQMKKIILQK